MILDKAKYLWKFSPFGRYEKAPYRTEYLYSHQVISADVLGAVYDKEAVLSHQRVNHRMSVAEKLAEAMYEGWMPYAMEWWEGKSDDYHVLSEYHEVPNDDYHFWTRMRLASISYPILKRDPEGAEMTIMSYEPRRLS